MACLRGSELWRETEKVKKLWVSNKTIEKWGFTEDIGAFKRIFESSTGKELLAGFGVDAKDMRKFKVGIDDFIGSLKSPGVLSNKIIRSLFVGQSAYHAGRVGAASTLLTQCIDTYNYGKDVG